MPPDVLPVLGNRYGDWLCLRLGADDRVAEILHWYHGGGDWIPWGRTLAEAIAFQQIRDRLSGPEYRHSDPAEIVRRSAADDPLFAWARQHLPAEVTTRIDQLDAAASGSDAKASLDALLATDVAVVPLHAEAILRALETPLRNANRTLLAGLPVDWETEARLWRFDADLIPESQREAVAGLLEVPAEALNRQDWDRAERLARRVAAMRCDLAWAGSIVGWAAERRGDRAAAAVAYCRVLPASAFADQSVRFRIHGHEQDKFAGERLESLLAAEPNLLDHDQAACHHRDYWQCWSKSSPAERPAAVAAYWAGQADQAAAEGDWPAAYHALVAQGWDLGLPSLVDYVPLLQQIVAAAQHAGYAARAAVATTHLQCLQQRFPG